MASTTSQSRVKDLPDAERADILRRVLATYRRLCGGGFKRRARSSAIQMAVKAPLRGKRTGDYDRWWKLLDEAIKSDKQNPNAPLKNVATAAEKPAPAAPEEPQRKTYWWERL